MLSDPVAEAFGLIHRHPSGENFWYGGITTEMFGVIGRQALYDERDLMRKCYLYENIS